MKAEILQILEMQSDGKLSRDQAAELLAILADQAREKDGAASTHAAPSREAPGPRGDSVPPAIPHQSPGRPGPQRKGCDGATASAAIHELVDTAIGVGTTVGRVATNWGNEFLNMVHRDEGGNSVTLSKVDSPCGEGFSFRGNVINVSKIAGITLHQAELCGNKVNASKLSDLSILRGRFTQCDLNGSSVSHVTLEGPEAIVLEGASTDIPATGFRAVIFNASKCSRIKATASSHLENCNLTSSVAKDWELSDQSSMKEVQLTDSVVTGLRMARATFKNVAIERSAVHALAAREATLEAVKFTSVKCSGLSINGGTWKAVTFRRDALGTGSGGRDSNAQETTFDNCTLTQCEFAGCTFRRTTFRNLNLSGVTVRNVDFTGLTLETEEAFRQAAGM